MFICLLHLFFGLQTDGLTIISENDWKCFCEEWGGIEDTGILGEIKLRNTMEKNNVGSCQEMPITDTEDRMDEAINDEVEAKEPVIKSFPEVLSLLIVDKVMF